MVASVGFLCWLFFFFTFFFVFVFRVLPSISRDKKKHLLPYVHFQLAEAHKSWVLYLMTVIYLTHSANDSAKWAQYQSLSVKRCRTSRQHVAVGLWHILVFQVFDSEICPAFQRYFLRIVRSLWCVVTAILRYSDVLRSTIYEPP